MNDLYRLGLSVTHADGRITRWGLDEFAAQDVPTGLSFGTSIPGGFKDATCALLRRLDVDYPDEALFDSLRVYGPGNETVWEGRMAQLPRQHGDQFSVTPGAVGWSAHLEDDPSFREIYVDRDMSRWTDGPSTQRRLDLFGQTGNWQITETGSVESDDAGNPALTLRHGRIAVTGLANSLDIAESWYDAQGIPIDRIYYEVLNSSNMSADWVARANVCSTQRDSTGGPTANFDQSANHNAAGPTVSGGYLATTTATRIFANHEFFFNAAFTGDGAWHSFRRKLAVYGRHGLTRQGSDPGGFYASDVIANIVARAAPLLTYSTGTDGSISPTTFVIPQLAFLDPTTAADAIGLINGYHLYEWGVYDNRTFFWRPPDPDRLTWTCRLSDGAQVSLEGDDANNIFSGVFVTFTDPSGKKHTAGPPGSGADTTDASLVDTDPANPINAHGIPRRWGRLDVSQTTTTAGAVQLGAVWLNEHKLPARRGQLTLTGTADHPTQGKRPVWAIRAGDYIRIADRSGDPVRRIIETSYDHDSRRLTASLDNTVFKLDSILERLGVGLVGVV